MPQLQLDAARAHRTDERKSKLKVRSKPFAAEAVSGPGKIAHHVFPIQLHEVGQHEAVVQAGSPSDQFLPVRLAPEMRDQRPHQELLSQAHACVGRHLEGAQLEQAETRPGAFRRIELVDAKLRAMRAPGYVGEQMTEEAIRNSR